MKRFISTTSAVAAVLFFTGISFAQGGPVTTKPLALDVPAIQLNMGVASTAAANQSKTVAVNQTLDLPTIQSHLGAAPEWSLHQRNAASARAIDLPAVQLQTGR